MALEKLTDAHIRAAKCSLGNSSDDLHDGRGLFLRVKASGTKSWNFQWSAPKGSPPPKRPKMGLGAYPAVTLAKARVLAGKCREQLADGIDPRDVREQVHRPETFEDSFWKFFRDKKAFADEKKANNWSSGVRTHVLPKIGKRPVAAITIEELVKVLQPIWDREVGRKLLPKLVGTMRYARTRNPSILNEHEDVAGAIKDRLSEAKRSTRHHPALPWERAPDLWVELGEDVIEISFKFYLLNMSRVSNVRFAKWSQIDFDLGVWDIPAEGGKNGFAFAAPLARESLALLRVARKRFPKSDDDLIFPNPASFKTGVVTENAWTNFLAENKWPSTDERYANSHGLRATFGTWAGDNEVCDQKMAARCIQHKVENAADAAYLRSKLLKQRRRVMQRWADFVTSGEREAAEAENRARDFKEELDSIAEPSGRTHRDIANWSRATADEWREAKGFDDARKVREALEAKDHYSQDE